MHRVFTFATGRSGDAARLPGREEDPRDSKRVGRAGTKAEKLILEGRWMLSPRVGLAGAEAAFSDRGSRGVAVPPSAETAGWTGGALLGMGLSGNDMVMAAVLLSGW